MRHSFFCIDSHTCGNPVRVVAAGGPPLPHLPIFERREIFVRDHNWVRRALMFEPRGHDVMSGAILYPAFRDDCDFAALFIEVSGCLPICGAGTIGLSTVVIEEGLVRPRTPGTLSIETPAGRVAVQYEMDGDFVRSVRLFNVASYLHSADIEVDIPGVGRLMVDVAYGGNFAVVEPQQNWSGLDGTTTSELVSLSQKLRTALAEICDPVHPEDDRIRGVHHAIWCDRARCENADGRVQSSMARRRSTVRRRNRNVRPHGPVAGQRATEDRRRVPKRKSDRHDFRRTGRSGSQGRDPRRHHAEYRRMGADHRTQHDLC